MKEHTREMLRIAQQQCDDEDRSTEYMLVYMQDFASVDLECVLKFLNDDEKKRTIINKNKS